MHKKIDLILLDALVAKGLMKEEALRPLLKEAENSGQSLKDVLQKKGALPEQDLLNILGEKLNLPCLSLRGMNIEKVVIDKVPVKVASYYHFLPLKIQERVLTIAVASPLDIKIQDEIRAQLGYDIEIVLSPLNDILDNLKKYYGLAAETLEKISVQVSPAAKIEEEPGTQKIEDIEKLAEDASVIKLVNQIILDAYRKRATDIHIEPYRQGLSLRYRIDGILYDSNVPGELKNFLNAIISRIKIMSNLNIVERRLPQDGRAVVKVQEQLLDLRISTMPTPYGESVVIRILPTQMLYSLEKLGLSKRDLQIFESLIQKPHGIIFVTGPTGSGKTTSLYACLNRINTRDRKIITIEDPIEYEMSQITQIQVMPEIGLDFARGLRSILRHDPDVIMVGEVRDLETAEIAIRVALTGHLIFSTLHTNDAASGITRLVDIGVEPYLVASSIEAFISQRLIRLICADCKVEDRAVPKELKEMITRDLGLRSIEEVRIFRGKGCPNCNFTGFYGRSAIYEILLADNVIKELILKKSPSGEIKKIAISRGMRTLRQDGWQRVIAGLTTPEEVVKVTSAEELEEKEADNTFFYHQGTQPEEAHLQTLQFDKRAYRRLKSKVNLRYRRVKPGEVLLKKGLNAEELSVTRDISAGGLLFVADEALRIGEILELKIELPGEKKAIDCLAKVARVAELEENKNYNIAVYFLDLTGADRTKLEKYVESEGGS